MVRELVGHGLGKHLHEEPQVPNYGRRGAGAKLKEGLVLAIEPMIILEKKKFIRRETDGPCVRWIISLPSTLSMMWPYKRGGPIFYPTIPSSRRRKMPILIFLLRRARRNWFNLNKG